MATLYNPGGSKTNCGFCSIAFALHTVKNQFVDADRLYTATLERLGLHVENGRDPIPRQLIFPEPNLDSLPISHLYRALEGTPLGLSGYTITSVASANHLNFDFKMSGLDLPRQFVKFSAETPPKQWSLTGFVDWRRNWLNERGLNPPVAKVREQIVKELEGTSIIGSKTSNHYINMRIDPSGVIRADDPQDGRQYDGKGLSDRMLTLDLMMRIK